MQKQNIYSEFKDLYRSWVREEITDLFFCQDEVGCYLEIMNLDGKSSLESLGAITAEKFSDGEQFKLFTPSRLLQENLYDFIRLDTSKLMMNTKLFNEKASSVLSLFKEGLVQVNLPWIDLADVYYHEIVAVTDFRVSSIHDDVKFVICYSRKNEFSKDGNFQHCHHSWFEDINSFREFVKYKLPYIFLIADSELIWIDFDTESDDYGLDIYDGYPEGYTMAAIHASEYFRRQTKFNNYYDYYIAISNYHEFYDECIQKDDLSPILPYLIRHLKMEDAIENPSLLIHWFGSCEDLLTRNDEYLTKLRKDLLPPMLTENMNALPELISNIQKMEYSDALFSNIENILKNKNDYDEFYDTEYLNNMYDFYKNKLRSFEEYINESSSDLLRDYLIKRITVAHEDLKYFRR